MAQRRMFSPQIVCSEEFLTMPVSSRELYFQLGMKADDDGFIQPKLVMKLTGATDDDLKVLLVKRFLISFEGGVVVIKHWLIHNLIQKDRYHPTRFQDQKKLLLTKENKAYTENPSSVNKMLPEVRLGKVRLGKDIDPAQSAGDEIGAFIKLFGGINPSYGELFKRKTQRAAAERLLKQHPLSWWVEFMNAYPTVLDDRFCPKATTPAQMEDKFAAIMAYGRQKQAEGLKAKQKIWV